MKGALVRLSDTLIRVHIGLSNMLCKLPCIRVPESWHTLALILDGGASL